MENDCKSVIVLSDFDYCEIVFKVLFLMTGVEAPCF